MQIRILTLMLLLQTIACQKATNALSNIRLDCGQDISWDQPYLKFVDGAGNPLSESMLEYRSLENQSQRSLNLTSKGCLALEKSGLWLIRHREKPEGLVIDFSKTSVSATLQLRNTSQENLKPDCPAYETGHTLDLQSILNAETHHDLRGYEIRFSLRSDKFQKNWPRHNFYFLTPIQLAGTFPEGIVRLELIVTNNFQGGEEINKSCMVKFDYTGPTIEASLQQGQPKTYKGRPFIALSSDVDVRFTSTSDDFSNFDVCFQRRADWDSGEPYLEMLPLCEKPERVSKERPVPFDARRGFWQIQYRGIDPAGNASEWSNPFIILFEQQLARQKIVNIAVRQNSEISARSYLATPTGMLDALEIYKDWQNLPTAYEREEMESSILLALHRPWMEPTIQVNLRMTPPNHFPKLAFPVMGGKKFISIESGSEPKEAPHLNGKSYFIATLTDINSLVETRLPAPDLYPDGWQVTKDGKRFFWYSMDRVYYGKLHGDEVKIQILDYSDQNVNSARFLKEDSQLVVLTGKKLRFFNAEDELKEIEVVEYPVDVHSTNLVPTMVPISDDARSILMADDEKNTLVNWSLFEENSRIALDFNPELIPGFSTSYDGIKVLDTDRHFYISLSYANLPYCSYYYYNAELSDQEKAKMMLEAMPCDRYARGTPLENDVWMSGPNDIATVVYKPGSAQFRDPVMNPALPADRIKGASLNRYITDSGQWMFSGSTEVQASGEDRGHARVWKKNEIGTFELFAEFWTCNEFSEPYAFQFDETNQVLYHLCTNYEGAFSTWNLAVNPPQLIKTIEVAPTVMSALLLNGQLFIGSTEGQLHVYDLHGHDEPTFSKKIKLAEHTIVDLTFDPIHKRLYTTEIFGSKPIKSWDISNLRQAQNKTSTPLRQMERTTVSRDGKYLAASGERHPVVFIWNAEDSKSFLYKDHTDSIRDLSFIGDTSILATGSFDGTLKLWDVKNPDMPAVTFSPGLARTIKNIASLPRANEFVLETNDSRIFHYRLDSFDRVLDRTCEALRVYLHHTQDTNPEQAAFCKARQLVHSE